MFTSTLVYSFYRHTYPKEEAVCGALVLQAWRRSTPRWPLVEDQHAGDACGDYQALLRKVAPYPASAAQRYLP